MNEVQERLNKFINYLNISVSQFEQSIGVGNAFVSNTNARMRNSSKNLISSKYPELNMDWLIKGKGEMLNIGKNTINSSGSNSANAIHGNATFIGGDNTTSYKLPFYEEVSSIGGQNSLIADVDINNQKMRKINLGELFHNATSAIKHYGDSMKEYPSGCILILRRVTDKTQIVWGRNYCIETDELRITKRIQNGGEYNIIAHSTNTDKDENGNLIHSPITIPKKNIRHLDYILGYIMKE